MKLKNILTILTLMFVITSCDNYKDWKSYVSYSDAFPICGEWYVLDYDGITGDTIVLSGQTMKPYSLYIYNKAYNPTKDSIWIDNTGHAADDGYNNAYKIKCKADIANLSFNCDTTGNVPANMVNPPLNPSTKIVIVNSKIWDRSTDIANSEADSIYFEYTYKKSNGEIGKRITAGHRKTGWENPNWDDPM